MPAEASVTTPSIVVGCYRQDDRGPLDDIINTSFPVLLPILQNLVANPSPATHLAEYVKLVCKIFWSSTFMGIPAVLLQQQQFSGWMTALHQAVRKPVPWVSTTF